MFFDIKMELGRLKLGSTSDQGLHRSPPSSTLSERQKGLDTRPQEISLDVTAPTVLLTQPPEDAEATSNELQPAQDQAPGSESRRWSAQHSSRSQETSSPWQTASGTTASHSDQRYGLIPDPRRNSSDVIASAPQAHVSDQEFRHRNSSSLPLPSGAKIKDTAFRVDGSRLAVLCEIKQKKAKIHLVFIYSTREPDLDRVVLELPSYQEHQSMNLACPLLTMIHQAQSGDIMVSHILHFFFWRFRLHAGCCCHLFDLEI